MTRIEALLDKFRDPKSTNLRAFARVVRAGESSQEPIAYRMRYGGHGKPPVIFEDLRSHPKVFEITKDGRKSSAAGAYQATWTTWNDFQKDVGQTPFDREFQDAFFVWCVERAGALDLIEAGEFDEACRRLHPVWTSLPGGSEENAATKKARETYVSFGGSFAQPSSETDTLETEHYESPKEVHMPLPLLAEAAIAFLPKLIDLIPALGSALGSGSEVQKRNIAGATAVAKAITEAVGEPTVEGAIQAMRSDPAKLAEARRAVDEILPTLGEAGGGGIRGAREAAASQSGSFSKLVFSLPFVGILVFTPTIWAVVAAAVFKASWLMELDAQLRGAVIGAVMGTLAGSIAGYIYGASMTKTQQPQQPLAER